MAWTWVCLPKKNGGLGVRDCIARDYIARNVDAVGKFVWQVAQKEDVLWINGYIICIVGSIIGGSIKLIVLQVGIERYLQN